MAVELYTVTALEDVLIHSTYDTRIKIVYRIEKVEVQRIST